MSRDQWTSQEGHLDSLRMFRDFVAEALPSCDVQIGIDPTDVLETIADLPLIVIDDSLPLAPLEHGWGGARLLSATGFDVDVYTSERALCVAIANSVAMLGPALMEDPQTGVVEAICTALPASRPFDKDKRLFRRGLEYAVRYHTWNG